MAERNDISPNKIADTYEALSDFYTLVSTLADARTAITDEQATLLHRLAEIIHERRAEFGLATADRNSFTMAEYRDAFGEQLPTIETRGLTHEERQPLEWLGIIDEAETFRIPCLPSTGERLPIWPQSGGLNLQYANLAEFSVPQPAVNLVHISDTHLGYQNRSKPGGGGKTKWVDHASPLTQFQGVLQQAIEDDADAVIHTGDLFDHDVDHETLEATLSAIDTLTESGIPFYFILGDHDRLATGGTVPNATDAIQRLEAATSGGSITHCTVAGEQIDESAVSVFGMDATGIGFSEIRQGYSLNGWHPQAVQFGQKHAGRVNLLCVHEPVETTNFANIIGNARQQNLSLDLILVGHEHRPPFDGEWMTEIDGVSIACAGPTTAISSHFQSQLPGYNRIRVEEDGQLTIVRRTL